MDMLFENADFQNDIFLREHQTALKNLQNCLTIVSIRYPVKAPVANVQILRGWNCLFTVCWPYPIHLTPFQTSNLMADLQNLRHEIDNKRKQECIQLYESTMKILTSFSEIFRQFNIEIQTTSFKLDANVRDCGGGGGNSSSGGGSSSSGTVMTNGYGNHSFEDADTRLKEFIYPKYDISIYKENFFGDGVVAYVEDAERNLCFIIDAER